MKKLTMRALSLILTLAVFVGLFAAMALSANAASYTYNSGTRGAKCTALSSKAKAYYTGSYTYANLSAKSGSSLRTALRALVKQKNNTVGYNGLRSYMKYSDASQGSTSKMVLFYSGKTCTSTWDSGKTWNREHLWPQSLGGNAVEGDLHAMRPVDPTANSSRNNNLYGETGSNAKTMKTSSKNGSAVCGYYYNGVFEPKDEVKGDAARVILYDYVMASSMSSVTEVFTDVNTLLNWCKSDPVDTFEMSRNDSVQSIQGSRNPFIDYPELGWKLLGKSVPSGMTTPSSSTGTSTTTNTGSNTGSNSGSTVSSGNSVTVTYMIGSKTYKTEKVSSGGRITLPTPSSSSYSSGYTFMGWTTSSVSSSTTAPTTYKAGNTYTISASITLRALFKVTGSTSSGGTYTKVTSTPSSWAGTYLIVYEGEKMVMNGSLSNPDVASNYKTVTISGSTIKSTSTINKYAVTISAVSGGYAIKTASGYYIGRTSDANGMNKSTSTKYVNTISVSSSGTATIKSGGAYLRFNTTSGQDRFRYFKSSTYASQKSICLYKLSSSSSTSTSTYYTTNN